MFSLRDSSKGEEIVKSYELIKAPYERIGYLDYIGILDRFSKLIEKEDDREAAYHILENNLWIIDKSFKNIDFIDTDKCSFLNSPGVFKCIDRGGVIFIVEVKKGNISQRGRSGGSSRVVGTY